MDMLGWLWWGVTGILGFALSLAWFLLGGWVSTLAQIAVIALILFGYKYGWRRAPQEILARLGGVGRFLWGWVRTREAGAAPPRVEFRDREVIRHVHVRVREPGDVNLSTVLNVLMLAGLAIAMLV